MKRNAEQYGLPLKILSYHELYGGWTMDKVVGEIGKKGNCSSRPSLPQNEVRVRVNNIDMVIQVHIAACSVDKL